MKFIGQLGKFEDIQSNDSPYEFESKMNTNDSRTFKSDNLQGPNDAFDLLSDDGDGNPF